MIGRKSRYASCILYRDASGEYLGRRDRIDTTPRYDDRLHTVIAGDRIDLIAYRYLDDAKLWWVICDYNDIFFPLELIPGTELRIPSMENVSMNLLG